MEDNISLNIKKRDVWKQIFNKCLNELECPGNEAEPGVNRLQENLM